MIENIFKKDVRSTPNINKDSLDSVAVHIKSDYQYSVIFLLFLPLAVLLSVIGGDNVDYFMFPCVQLLASF